MKRSILLLTILSTLVLNFEFSNAQMVEHTVYNAPLSKSINLKKVTENYGTSINRINILEADLNDKNNTIDVLFNTQGLYKTMSIKDVASSTPGTVAAANADFFLMQSPSSSIGPLVKNHKLLASPAETANKYAAIVVTDDNKVSFEYVNPGVIVKNLTKGKDNLVYTYNKVLSQAYKGVTIRSSDFSYYTFGKDDKNPNRVEVIVGSDGIVKEIRDKKESVKIPYGGYAIMSFNIDGTPLKNQYSVGDKIDLKLNITNSRNDIKTVIGGGSVLIKNSVKTPLSSRIPGKAQRTAVAVTKDNKLLIVTNDGRLYNSAGFDEKDMQNYLYSLGVKDAIILDGGGSTELYVDKKVQNTLFGERKVINAIALKNDNQSGNIDKVYLTPLSDLIYTGDSVEVIASAQDKNGSKITKYNTPDFQLTTQGFNSKILSRTIVPITAGSGKISATIKGVTGTANVNVLNSHAPDSKNVKGQKENKKFNIYPDMDNKNDIVSQFIKAKIIKNSNQNDTNIVLDNKDRYFTNNLKGNTIDLNAYYYKNALKGTDLLTINNSISLGASDVQLNGLKNTVTNSANKNLVIVLSKGKEMISSHDQHFFDKLLESQAKKKNIYVIYKADSYDAYKKGNVSYISLVDLKKQNFRDLKNVKYLEMFEDANQNIIYSFKQIFS